jgi:hypothetical protein
VVCCVVAKAVVAVHLLVALDPLEPHRQQLLQLPQLRLDDCRADTRAQDATTAGQGRLLLLAAKRVVIQPKRGSRASGLHRRLADSLHA